MTLEQRRAMAMASARLRAQDQESEPAQTAPSPTIADNLLTGFAAPFKAVNEAAAGAVKGATDIGRTILMPFDALADKINGNTAPTLSSLVTGQKPQTTSERRAAGVTSFFNENADPGSAAFKSGELGAGIAGTAGTGGVLGKGVMALGRFLPGAANYLPKLATALESGGFKTGGPAATTAGQTATNLATRLGAGGLTGAAQAGLINPDEVGSGAAIGVAGPVVGKIAGELGKGAKAAIYDPLANQRSLIGEALLRAVGPGAGQQVAAGMSRRAATPGVRLSAGEASGDAAINGIEDVLRAGNAGGALNRNAQTNRTALADAVRAIAQDDAAVTTAESARTAGTAPLRDAALTNADYGTSKTLDLQTRLGDKVRQISNALRDRTTLQTRASQNAAEASNRFPGVPLQALGESSAVGEAFPDIQRLAQKTAMQDVGIYDIGTVVAQRQAERDMLGRQLDSLQQAGYSPLNAGGLIKGISATLSKPGIRASDVVQKTLGEVKEKLAGLTDANGNLSAQDLYTVRKEIGNTISKHAKESANWDQNLAAGLNRDIQKSMDDAIRKAGAGDLWDQYLTKYQELSRPIDQMKVGKVLAEKLIPSTAGDVPTSLNAASLATALRNPDAVAQGATGFGRARMTDVMTPAQMQAIEGVSGDASRIAEMHKLGAGYGSPTFRRQAISGFIGQNLAEKAPIVGKIIEALNSPGVNIATLGLPALGNMAAKSLNGKMVGKMEEMLATDPQGTADLIRQIISRQAAPARTMNPQLQAVIRTLPTVATSQASP